MMRRNIRVCAVFVMAVLISAACAAPGASARQPAASASVQSPALPRGLRVRVAGRVTTVALDEYVAGTALSEVSPVGENAATVDRIFDVQTVIARTYAVASVGRHRADGFDLCDTTHCQVYQPARLKTSRFSPAARRAVQRTRGIILTYGDRPAEALFHSDCGGHTADAGDVWGGQDVPYLVGAPDRIPSFSHSAWQFEMAVTRVRAALNAEPQSRIGNRLDAIAIAARDSSGRASTIELRGERRRTLRGDTMRAILNRTFGDRAIRSTKFTVRKRGTAFEFTGTGWGHGVGLCQVGAAARARRGDSLGQILETYFPGTAVTRQR